MDLLIELAGSAGVVGCAVNYCDLDERRFRSEARMTPQSEMRDEEGVGSKQDILRCL